MPRTWVATTWPSRAFFLLNKLGECIELLLKGGRFPEAAFFARTYAPSEVPRIVELWREDLARTNPAIAQSLANPEEYPNLFPNFLAGIDAQKIFQPYLNLPLQGLPAAAEYLNKVKELDRDLIAEAELCKQRKETLPVDIIPPVTSEENFTGTETGVVKNFTEEEFDNL